MSAVSRLTVHLINGVCVVYCAAMVLAATVTRLVKWAVDRAERAVRS